MIVSSVPTTVAIDWYHYDCTDHLAVLARWRRQSATRIGSFSVGEAVYHLRVVIEGRLRPRPEGGWEFWCRELRGITGIGENPTAAQTDWETRVHAGFQDLFGKRPFEMTAEETVTRRQLAQLINVELYEQQTPLRLRQIGRIAKARPYPSTVEWVDGRREDVDLRMMPAEFAAYKPGYWFEAVVERDRQSWRLRRVVDVHRIAAPQPLSAESLERYWQSLRTTAQLPAASPLAG